MTSRPATTGTAAGVAGAARLQLDWYVGYLASTEPILDDEYERRFAAAFRQAVPLRQFEQVTAQLRPEAPFALESVTFRGGRRLEAVAVGRSDSRVRITLGVDGDDRIDELVVRPAAPPELDDPPATIAAAAEHLRGIGDLRLVAAHVDGEDCVDIDGHGAAEQAPIASVFKLYVLGAVADAIAAGSLGWDDKLTITAGVKSLPGGALPGRPDGSTVTVREAAELMISISDNTAADLLMAAVGREAVEAAQSRYGHSQPTANIPFPTTREMFALKVADPALQERWITGDQATRRTVLSELPAPTVASVSALGGRPAHPDRLEWFASPSDLCRVLSCLAARWHEPSLTPLRQILTANPGTPSPEGRWRTVAFKGGSEPGLLAAAWLVEDHGGRWFSLTASVVDPERALDEEQAVLLMASARDLLGR